MYSRLVSAVALVAGGLAIPTLASADWIVRAGGAYMVTEQGDINVGTSSELDFDDDGPVVAGDITWLPNEHIGIELWSSYTFNSGIFFQDGGARRGVDDVDFLAPTLTLQWHFNRDGWFRPYLGVGGAYVMMDGSRLDYVGIDDDFGWTAGGGIDMGQPSRGWFVNAYAKYIDFSPEAKVNTNPAFPIPGGSTEYDLGNWDINPMVYGINIGYRFGKEPEAPAPVEAAPPPAPPPPPPPPPPRPADSDGDGVPDNMDKCPNTPAGTRVDSVGCPLEQTLRLLFDFDSAELRPESITELERVVTFMGDVPFAKTMVEGHTDSSGSDAYNQSLSDRRAKAVFDYLTSRGVDPARLSSVGKGESAPIADNATEEGRQENRRVMLIRTDSGM